MVNQTIWIGITIGVFFLGIGISYGLLADTSESNSLNFQSQQTFDQMMSQNPKMAQQWLDSMMLDPQFMQTMIQNDEFMHEMMEMMSEQDMMGGSMMSSGSVILEANPTEQHEMMLELMETIADNEDLRNHMFAHMLEDEKVVHKMLTIMSKAPHLKDHMEAHVSGDLSEYAYLDEEDHEEHGHDDEH